MKNVNQLFGAIIPNRIFSYCFKVMTRAVTMTLVGQSCYHVIGSSAPNFTSWFGTKSEELDPFL